MTLHPLLAAAIGRDVRVTYRGDRPGALVVNGQTIPQNVVGTAAGRLDVIGDRHDVPTHLAIETDGSVAIIPIARILTIETEA